MIQDYVEPGSSVYFENYGSVTIDLNGSSLNGTLVGTDTYVYDSQTDDYTVQDDAGYGVLSGTVSGVVAADNYVMLSLEEGISFHKADVALDKLTLRASNTGLYYTGSFLADELLLQNVTYGVALSTECTLPVADDSDATCLYTIGANSVLVKDFMSTEKSAAENAENAKTKVYARAYMKLADGNYLYSSVAAVTLQRMVETVDAKLWDSLSDAQRAALIAMYQTFGEAMADWEITNLKNA